MNVSEAVFKRRTIRRYKQQPLEKGLLEILLDAARVAPCGGNMQHIRYSVVSGGELLKKVFAETMWGAWVKPARSPIFGKTSPAAFIVLSARSGLPVTVHADAGAAIQSMYLAATELGLGCCWIGAFNRTVLSTILAVPQDMELLYLLAVGYPDEAPLREDIGIEQSSKYYLDEADVLHVPKYKREAIVTWL